MRWQKLDILIITLVCRWYIGFPKFAGSHMICRVQNNSLTKENFYGNALFVRAFMENVWINCFSQLKPKAAGKLLENGI